MGKKNKINENLPLSFVSGRPKPGREIPISENPLPENELNQFFIKTFLAVAFIFFLVGSLVYFLDESFFMQTWTFKIAYGGTPAVRTRSICFIASGLVVIPMFQLYGFDRRTVIRFLIFSILFLAYITFYITIVSIITDWTFFVVPLISTGVSFLICAVIGYFFNQVFYIKIISYLKLIIGFFAMIIIHRYIHPSFYCWFVAFPIFWIYDFIAADKYKLIYAAKLNNMSPAQKLFMSSIAVFLAIPIHRSSISGSYKSGKWFNKNRW